MYNLSISHELEKKLKKISKKNPEQLKRIIKKVEEIVENPTHYKNLRAPLNKYKRAHIDDHFVLRFSVNEKQKIVILEDFAHHDEIYQ